MNENLALSTGSRHDLLKIQNGLLFGATLCMKMLCACVYYWV